MLRIFWQHLLIKIVIPVSIITQVATGAPVATLIFSDSAIVNDTLIKLGDIAQVTGVSPTIEHDLLKTNIGQAAPPGYARFVNTCDLMAFCLKPLHKNIHFNQPMEKRVRIQTDFQEKQIGDIENHILNYLSDNIQWKPGNYSIKLLNRERTFRCLKKPFEVKIEGLNTEYPKGKISITGKIIHPKSVLSVPITCEIKVTTPVLVATTTIRRNENIQKEMVEIKEMDITRYVYQPMTQQELLTNMVASRVITQGTIIHDKLIKKRPIVYKGDFMFLQYQRKNIAVSISVRARENGALGDHIWVENLKSHMLLKVRVTGKLEAQVIEG